MEEYHIERERDRRKDREEDKESGYGVERGRDKERYRGTRRKKYIDVR